MKPFTALSIVFLALLSLMQLVRFLEGWDVVVNGIPVPTWASGIASVVAGALAILLWRESRR